MWVNVQPHISRHFFAQSPLCALPKIHRNSDSHAKPLLTDMALVQYSAGFVRRDNGDGARFTDS